MSRLLLPVVLAISTLHLTAGVAGGAGSGPRSPVVAVSAESDRHDADGTEHFLHVAAERSGRASRVWVDGFVAGPVTCSDGSTADAFTLITGSGPGAVEVSGPLDRAAASARLDLTVETLAGCAETVGNVTVLRARPVAVRVEATEPALRVLTTARVRVPGSRNEFHLERQTLRSASGAVTVDSETAPTTSATIERDHTIAHGGDAATSFLASLATVDHERSTIRQARGAFREQAEELPPVGGTFGRFADVTAETVNRTETTIYAAAGTDVVIDCGDGGLGVLSTIRFGSAPGKLAIGPRFRWATAAARVPMTELVLNGCSGEAQERDLGDSAVSADLTATGPVLTATDFRVFSTKGARGHERVSIVGRDGVTGTVRIGALSVAPTEGGIGKRSAVSHRTGTGG